MCLRSVKTSRCERSTTGKRSSTVKAPGAWSRSRPRAWSLSKGSISQGGPRLHLHLRLQITRRGDDEGGVVMGMLRSDTVDMKRRERKYVPVPCGVCATVRVGVPVERWTVNSPSLRPWSTRCCRHSESVTVSVRMCATLERSVPLQVKCFSLVAQRSCYSHRVSRSI